MEYEQLIHECLQTTFGFREFKVPQKEIIQNIISKRNRLEELFLDLTKEELS